MRRENILKPQEIPTEILIPLSAPGSRSAYWKRMERDAWDFALVSVAAAVRQDNGKVEQARIVMGELAPHSRRAPAAGMTFPFRFSSCNFQSRPSINPRQ